MRRALFALFIAASWSEAALAQSFLCPYEARSQQGGRLEISGVGTREQSIGWHPAARGTAIDLEIGYADSSIEKLSSPSGGNLEVRFGEARPLSINITIDDLRGWTWTSKAKVGDYGIGGKRDIRAWVAFNKLTEEGRRMIAMVVAGRKLRARVEADGKLYSAETFDLAQYKARDELLTQLNHKIESHVLPKCAENSGPLSLSPISE